MYNTLEFHQHSIPHFFDTTMELLNIMIIAQYYDNCSISQWNSALWAKIFKIGTRPSHFFAISTDFDADRHKKNDNFTRILKIVFDSVIRQS